MNSTQRSSFTGRLGFVLAAAGSAVGLGNIWRFPYLAAKYGGGIFLLVYIALSVTFGFSLMVAEIALGRKTRQSPIGAYRHLHPRFGLVGALAIAVSLLILPYYAVVGGWIIKYALNFISGNTAIASDYFSAYTGRFFQPFLWFLIFLAATALIVLCGVQKGIERVSRFVMPVLIALMLFIVIYSLCTVDGATDGLIYYLKPDFGKFSIKTVVAALCQLFFSMSLAMGVMITFGSYMQKDVGIERAAHRIELFDSGIAILAGLMIVPACFAFSGGDPEALGAGPGLMFGVLPQIFSGMPAGRLIGSVFFLTVLLAALTSSISMMETAISALQDSRHLSRPLCCMPVVAISCLLGTIICLGYSHWSNFSLFGMSLPDTFDFVTNHILLPVVALITCILLTRFGGLRLINEEISLSGHFKQRTMVSAVIRIFAPVCLVLILIWAIMGAFTDIELFQL